MKGSPQDVVQLLLDEMTSSGTERGVQVAVYHRGQLIVDAWSGLADSRTGRAVDGTTLFPVFSISKGITATIVHQLVERGRLSYDQPIAEVWPEFAAQGKGGITLRQALNHSAGIPNVPHRVEFAEITDWKKICAAVANLPPVFPAGTLAEYHAITYGWIVGETVCRVDGRSFPGILKEEIAGPLGLEGMFIGLPAEAAARVAFLEEYAPVPPPADPLAPSPVPGWLGPLHSFMNRPDMQRACIPASSGIMNARSIARHYAALLPGGVDGVELLPPSRIREATQPQGLRRPDGSPSTWALGYNLYEGYSLPGSGFTAFGHGAYGGAIGFADPGQGLAVGITKNLLNSGNTAERIYTSLIAVLH
jgi:CubicO group peptidase (beta-lactamase class C family)